MKLFILTIFSVLSLGWGYPKAQGRLLVPDNYETIQAAIDAAYDGDTILVNPGIYKGVIDFKGKAILVCSLFRLTGDTSYISNTIITRDASSNEYTKNRAVWFRSGETSESEISGFTISDFYNTCCGEGIIDIKDAYPTLSSLKIQQINGTDGHAITIKTDNNIPAVSLINIEILNAAFPITINEGKVTMINCRIAKCLRGVSCSSGGNLTIINSLIDDISTIFGEPSCVFSGNKLIILNSVISTKENYGTSLLAETDSLFIRNSIIKNITLETAESYIDTLGVFSMDYPLYYTPDSYRPSRYSSTIDKGIEEFFANKVLVKAPTVDIYGNSREWKPNNIIDIGPEEYKSSDNTEYRPTTISISSTKTFLCDDLEAYTLKTQSNGPAVLTSYNWYRNGSFYETTNIGETMGFGSAYYQVHVQDELNIPSVDDISIHILSPYTEGLNLVASYDFESSLNKIQWNKLPDKGIASYKIIKENSINQPISIGLIAYDQEPQVLDVDSNPAEGSFRYAIQVIDTCGHISPIGSYHQTIHLTANEGLNGEINLQWTAYSGSPVISYQILRGKNFNDLKIISEKSSSQFTFTDLNPPVESTQYVIEAILDPQSEFRVFSNRIATDVITESSDSRSIAHSLYPQPADGKLIIESNEEIISISIFDVTGKQLDCSTKINSMHNVEITTRDVKPGLYIILIYTASSINTHKILISH